MRTELANAMRAAGPELAGAMDAKAPRKTGKLIAGINWRFYPSQLKLRVGLLGKRLNQRLFYARILQVGRKAQTVTVTRRRKGIGKRLDPKTGRKRFEDIVATYQLRVKPRDRQDIIYGPTTNLRRVLGQRLNGIWDRVLRRVSGGGDE
jgi:hypothetical protein